MKVRAAVRPLGLELCLRAVAVARSRQTGRAGHDVQLLTSA